MIRVRYVLRFPRIETDAALTALYKWRMKYDPLKESYSLRLRDWRYIRYENGREELYHAAKDPHEWTNLADER